MVCVARGHYSAVLERREPGYGGIGGGARTGRVDDARESFLTSARRSLREVSFCAVRCWRRGVWRLE